MVILAFDQSTNVTGWGCLTNGHETGYGHIDLRGNRDKPLRMKEMLFEVASVIERLSPDLVYFEGVEFIKNFEAFSMLSCMQGMCLAYCYIHDIPVGVLDVATWRARLGYQLGRNVHKAELKQQSIDFVKAQFGIEDYTEDEAEALAIAYAAYLGSKE